MLYEEEGEVKVGTVLAQAPASFQVESPHGRRSKVKQGNVVLTFDSPSAAELLEQARRFAETLDVDFLWQCSSGEFDFRALARDYVGREPSAIEAAGVLLKLQSAPMYFYRRGKGRFQAAPEETAMPARSRFINWVEAVTFGKAIIDVFATRGAVLKILTCGKAAAISMSI